MASSSHCDLCGTEIVQGSCQNPECKNCTCVMDEGEDLWSNENKSKKDTMPRTLDFQQLCTEITERLAEMSGEDLAKIASQVMPDDVTFSYEGDGFFTMTEKE